jgi:DNA-binding CsgD family transcriptional regulator/tetratricopeptide (TPR) repeat protein
VPDPSSTPDFVGRNDELAAFQGAVAAARQGAPAVLLVGGEAGIGKSTLVTEGARRAGAELIVGRCVPMGGELIPLAPLAELLRNVRRTTPDALTESAFAPLRDWIGPGPADERPAAGALFGPLLELVASLGADGAVVVAFEDLHWADPLTWDLFDLLARNLVDEHVVLVGTYRANEVGANPQQRRRLGELARLPATRRMHVEGLSRDELAAKIQTLMRKVPPAKLIDEILARGQGNPFFTAELVAAHVNGQAIPAVLSDLIATELGGLDAISRSVVAVIAVVGHDTAHDLLMRVAEVDADTLEVALHAAIDAQLVVVDRDTDAYRFRHALIGEVVYDELLPPERKRLHRRIADALADQPPHLLARADRASELAVHLDRAGDHATAFGALLLAADAAETVAPAAALHHLERALELWDSAGEASAAANRGDRLWQAAELASGAAGNQRAADLAMEAFRCGAPPRGAAWGHERLGRYLWAAGHIEDCTAEFEAAAALLPDDGGPDAAPVFAGLGQAELMLGHYRAAEARAQSVFDLLSDAEADPFAWAMARRVLGIVVDHGGDPARGIDLCREAVEAAPNALTRMLAVLYLGVALLDAGAYQEAVNDMLDAGAEARMTGLDRSFGGYLDALAAEALIRLGRWSEADTILDHSEGTEAFPLGELRLAFAGALLAARRGDRDRAHALLAEAEARPVDPLHRWFLDRATAESHLALGEWAEAAEVAERALARDATALWQARFVMLGTAADVELALDARARRELVDPDAIAARLRGRIDAARVAAVTGQGTEEAPDSAAHLAHAAAEVTRLHDSDPDAWAEAARRWAHLGDPYWLATARVRETEAAAARGETARAAETLREAHQLASDLAAEILLTDIDAVSRRTRLSVDAPVARVLEKSAIDQLGLTAREAEVLSLVAAGQTNRQIGEALFVSEKTASVHVSNILRKLGVSSRVDAAAVAQRIGVT